GGLPGKEEDLLRPPQCYVERPLLLCRGDKPQSPPAGKTLILRSCPATNGRPLSMSSVLPQVVTAPIINWSEQFLSKLSLPNPLCQEVPNQPPDYYTCQFRTNKLERFSLFVLLHLHLPS
ncbi:hypothetical protein XENOCAPTIV_022493, partial [Xenoophorus captivus]